MPSQCRETAAPATSVAAAIANGASAEESGGRTTSPFPPDLKVDRLVRARIPTKHGEFYVSLYRSSRDPTKEHMAIAFGDVATTAEPVLVRIHSECFTGEVLGSLRCDCGEQLDKAMARIAERGVGVIVYLRQEGRGIGLLDKLRAYNLQDQGYDTYDANVQLGHDPDERTYDEAALILRDLNVESVHLMTNNQDKIEQLRSYGIKVVERQEMVPTVASTELAVYLKTKVERMRHLLQLPSHPFLPSSTSAVASSAI